MQVAAINSFARMPNSSGGAYKKELKKTTIY